MGWIARQIVHESFHRAPLLHQTPHGAACFVACPDLASCARKNPARAKGGIAAAGQLESATADEGPSARRTLAVVGGRCNSNPTSDLIWRAGRIKRMDSAGEQWQPERFAVG